MSGRIRVGIGGWTYEPWEGTFYPEDLPKTRQLEYAASQLTAIEVNGTFYRNQTPSTFAKWAGEAPDDFVFALKAPRFATNRKVLGDAAESIGKFFASGMEELGPKLGPILWQLAPTKKFDADDVAAYFALFPEKVGGLRLRHALEARHESFRDPRFIDLARKHGVAVVFADSAKYPTVADVTADFVYVRLEDAKMEFETGYSDAELDRWTTAALTWAKGGAPEGLPYVLDAKPAKADRDVFVFMINGAKVRAPGAAKAMIGRLG
ncbi:MAG: DUF72 domain-containing protein [Caulobacteraceae bacterium]